MTDWERVERLRAKGLSWDRIAEDPKVGFTAPPGTSPGRALRNLHYARRARGQGSPRSRKSPAREDALAPRFGSALRSRRGMLLGVGAIVGVVALVTYLVVFNPFTVRPPGSNVVSYCGGEGTAAHYHVLLAISIDGAQQALPYDPSQSGAIGYIDTPTFTNPALYCDNGGFHALHTHDGSGILHAELPPSVVNSGAIPTLGDFFTIWGQNLTSTHVWLYSGRVTATELDMNTGARTDFSSDPGSIPLWYPPQGNTANPYQIPPNWIFNGRYGDGASGGFFDGEIIWLNITGAPGGARPLSPPSPVDWGVSAEGRGLTADSSGLASSILPVAIAFAVPVANATTGPGPATERGRRGRTRPDLYATLSSLRGRRRGVGRYGPAGTRDRA